MSLQTKIAYLWLCPGKSEKKKSYGKLRVKAILIITTPFAKNEMKR